jgi:glucose/arabinose dehydrogenase
VSLFAAPGEAATWATGFGESTVFTGLTRPTAVAFSSDGRVFVAEKSGLLKVFDSLSDTTPTVFADLRVAVYDYWDRGLLGLALHPSFPATPYVYVAYTLDKNPANPLSPIPTWNDACPATPGGTTDGCVASGRVSRLTASGNAMLPGSEAVLLGMLNDGSGQAWCQQFPSHSLGGLAFGVDGSLYVSSGDGAQFLSVDFGQQGGTLPNPANPLVPRNPCGDPPGGVGGAMTPPNAQGGALRSQSLRRASGPVLLNGAVLRVDPDTGAPRPDNALIAHADENARRIVGYGLRNPFRIAVRPGTGEVWIGDVGMNNWEEVNRIPDPTAAPRNFGWPCYEGNGRQSGYDGTNLASCESLYAEGTAVAPHHTYAHAGSSSIAGITFYDSGNYPASYQGALFFTDYSRRIIWAMTRDGSGVPSPAQVTTFGSALSGGAVDLVRGPDGDIFYVDYDGGRVQRISYGGPRALATAAPTSGLVPLSVQFDGSGSTGTGITYAWDLDGDGQFDDSTAVDPTFVYDTAGDYLTRLRVRDVNEVIATSAPITIAAGNGAPTATILTPAPGLAWRVGDDVSFSGSGADPQEGPLSPARLSWRLIMQHCPSDCHEHVIQDFVGVASGSFPAPDHEYPAYLELRLTATDGTGLTGAASIDLHPETSTLRFETSTPGLQLSVNSAAEATPFTRSVIVGSSTSLSAPVIQMLGGARYSFSAWADGGAAARQVVAPPGSATYHAVYTQSLRFHTLLPCRVADTRQGSGALAPDGDRIVTVAGTCGVPATAKAVSLNLTATEPTQAGFLVLRSATAPVPSSSTINYGPGQTRANSATVGLSPAGQIAVRSGQAGGTVHFILDVNGYYE